MKNKKQKLIISGIIFLICFSPFTISRLSLLAGDEEILPDSPLYQTLEEEMESLENQEKEAVAGIEAIENEANSPSETPAVVLSQAQLPEDTISLSSSADTPMTANENNLPAENNSEEKGAEEKPVEIIDSAIAPAHVKMRVLLENGKVPSFKVKVRMIGVGEKIFEEEIDEDGKVEFVLTSGRYYGEIKSADNRYHLKESAPAFFLNADTQKDLETYHLVK